MSSSGSAYLRFFSDEVLGIKFEPLTGVYFYYKELLILFIFISFFYNSLISDYKRAFRR